MPTIHCYYYFVLVWLGLAVLAVVLYRSSPDDLDQFGSDSCKPICFRRECYQITNQMKRSIEPGLDLIWLRLQVSKQLQQLRIITLVCLFVLRVRSKSLRSLN